MLPSWGSVLSVPSEQDDMHNRTVCGFSEKILPDCLLVLFKLNMNYE